MTTDNEWQEILWNEKMAQSKETASGMVSGGEIVMDIDPGKGFFRVKLRNVQPATATPELINGLCQVLSYCATMFNLQVKQYVNEGGKNNG